MGLRHNNREAVSSMFAEKRAQDTARDAVTTRTLSDERPVHVVRPEPSTGRDGPSPITVNSSVPSADKPRLGRQMEAVLNVMAGGEWITLHQIACYVGGSECSVSARLRDLRNLHGWTVDRRPVPGVPGLFEYRATKEAT